MTSNAARATALMRALRAGLEGDGSMIRDLYTEDVKAWTPALSASSITELTTELERRDDAFSDIELEVRRSMSAVTTPVPSGASR